MEGILTLIILIIVFNLFNFLARALKGESSRQRGRVLVEKEELASGSDHPGQINSVRDEEEKMHDSFFDMQENEHYENDRVRIYPNEDTAIPVAEEATSKPFEKKGSSVKLSGNLKQVLTRKDSLLTAFIFHEIIDPPRTRRRKP